MRRSHWARKSQMTKLNRATKRNLATKRVLQIWSNHRTRRSQSSKERNRRKTPNPKKPPLPSQRNSSIHGIVIYFSILLIIGNFSGSPTASPKKTRMKNGTRTRRRYDFSIHSQNAGNKYFYNSMFKVMKKFNMVIRKYALKF